MVQNTYNLFNLTTCGLGHVLLDNTDILCKTIRYFTHTQKHWKFNLNLFEKMICVCHCTVYIFLNDFISNVTHSGAILCTHCVHKSV